MLSRCLRSFAVVACDYALVEFKISNDQILFSEQLDVGFVLCRIRQEGLRVGRLVKEEIGVPMHSRAEVTSP